MRIMYITIVSIVSTRIKFSHYYFLKQVNTLLILLNSLDVTGYQSHWNSYRSTELK